MTGAAKDGHCAYMSDGNWMFLDRMFHQQMAFVLKDIPQITSNQYQSHPLNIEYLQYAPKKTT